MQRSMTFHQETSIRPVGKRKESHVWHISTKYRIEPSHEGINSLGKPRAVLIGQGHILLAVTLCCISLCWVLVLCSLYPITPWKKKEANLISKGRQMFPPPPPHLNEVLIHKIIIWWNHSFVSYNYRYITCYHGNITEKSDIWATFLDVAQVRG